MPSVRDKITADLKAAMMSKDAVRTSAIRMLKAEILKAEADGKEMDDAKFLQLVKTMKNQREESIVEFTKANRLELAEKERQELSVLVTYLPASISTAELEKIVTEAIAEAGAKDMKAMGQVMKIAVAKAAGRADGKQINAIAKEKLSK